MNRPIHILAGLTALGVAGFALSLWTGRTDAGADKIAFPANYKDGVIYQVADRYDIKQYRELYASPAAIAAAKAGKPRPTARCSRWCSTRRWWTLRAIR